jgi:hypothetical protein
MLGTVRKFENRYGGHRYCGHRFLVQFLRPYLQCWRCEKPLGCLQLILRLYFMDHLCLRGRTRVWDLVGIWMRGCGDIYIDKEKKVVG